MDAMRGSREFFNWGTRMTRMTIKSLQKLRDDGVKIAVLTCLRRELRRDARRRRPGQPADRRLARHGAAGTRHHAAGDPRRHGLPHALRRPRQQKRSFLVADMPFGSYQESPQQAFSQRAELMAAAPRMVKLEGGAEFRRHDTISHPAAGVPVCGHLGLTPQSVHQFGGYRVQGKGEDAEQKLIEDAVELEAAGAGLLVLEAIPAKLGEQVTQRLHIPTIGIGAARLLGPSAGAGTTCSYVFPGKKARSLRNFHERSLPASPIAAERYVRAVRDGSFPAEETQF